MKPPAPPRVFDHYAFWRDRPPEQSARCTWWLARIAAGWRPNARVSAMGYDDKAEFFGVWMWEYLNVLYPVLAGLPREPNPGRRPEVYP